MVSLLLVGCLGVSGFAKSEDEAFKNPKRQLPVR